MENKVDWLNQNIISNQNQKDWAKTFEALIRRPVMVKTGKRSSS